MALNEDLVFVHPLLNKGLILPEQKEPIAWEVHRIRTEGKPGDLEKYLKGFVKDESDLPEVLEMADEQNEGLEEIAEENDQRKKNLDEFEKTIPNQTQEGN